MYKLHVTQTYELPIHIPFNLLTTITLFYYLLPHPLITCSEVNNDLLVNSVNPLIYANAAQSDLSAPLSSINWLAAL